jgi:hypothetical protein
MAPARPAVALSEEMEHARSAEPARLRPLRSGSGVCSTTNRSATVRGGGRRSTSCPCRGHRPRPTSMPMRLVRLPTDCRRSVAPGPEAGRCGFWRFPAGAHREQRGRDAPVPSSAYWPPARSRPNLVSLLAGLDSLRWRWPTHARRGAPHTPRHERHRRTARRSRSSPNQARRATLSRHAQYRQHDGQPSGLTDHSPDDRTSLHRGHADRRSPGRDAVTGGTPGSHRSKAAAVRRDGPIAHTPANGRRKAQPDRQVFPWIRSSPPTIERPNPSLTSRSRNTCTRATTGAFILAGLARRPPRTGHHRAACTRRLPTPAAGRGSWGRR